MNRVITIPSLSDNYIYVYQYNTTDVLTVDPCDSSAVYNVLKDYGLNLTMILATHNHLDHTAGISDLKNKTGCRVFGGSKTIPDVDHIVTDGQIVGIGNKEIHCIATPGHTRTSFCYYIPSAVDGKGVLFTGDTLFVAGCGRLFECDAKTMWASLQKLASLQDDTFVYCGHDYTVENLEFALTVEPDNEAVRKRLEQVKQAVSQGRQTTPSTISQEKQTNPFFRAGSSEIKVALNMSGAKNEDVFAELRRRKDVF